MNDIDPYFSRFMRIMYSENCNERVGYGEKILKYEDYIRENYYFLKDLYEKNQKTDLQN